MINKTKKLVQLSIQTFKNIITGYKQCKKDRDSLIQANKFLNQQIKEYNEKFGKVEK